MITWNDIEDDFGEASAGDYRLEAFDWGEGEKWGWRLLLANGPDDANLVASGEAVSQAEARELAEAALKERLAAYAPLLDGAPALAAARDRLAADVARLLRAMPDAGYLDVIAAFLSGDATSGDEEAEAFAGDCRRWAAAIRALGTPPFATAVVVTPADAVAYLNQLLELDRPAVAALVANRVPCNEALADHPTCQVGVQHGGFHVGLLGVLNGLFGTIGDGGPRDGWGWITAEFEDERGANGGRPRRFAVTDPCPPGAGHGEPVEAVADGAA